MYLKVGENQRAFEKLLDVTHLEDQHTNSLMALGAILQVSSLSHKNHIHT